jgi:hypothetical protein
MPANRFQRAAIIVFAYLGGVAMVVVLVWLALMGLELFANHSHPAVRDFDLAIGVVLFPVFLAVTWVTALVPFVTVRQCGGLVMRKCGGFANAWQDVGGGIATAILALPILVWEARFLDLENGPGPYLPALAAAVVIPGLWLAVIVGGAVGGLTYWWIDRSLEGN